MPFPFKNVEKRLPSVLCKRIDSLEQTGLGEQEIRENAVLAL